MTDWLMVIITAVYVVATILICWANIKSAEAAREQIEESRKQFEESNRAFITATFEVIKCGFAVLHIQNHGKRVAENVNIRISESFIAKIVDYDDREHIQKLCSASFTLGIGQSWYVGIGNHMDLEQMEEELLSIDISYKDSSGNYCEKTIIDLKQLNWMLINVTPEEEMVTEIKKMSKNIEKIPKSIVTLSKE